MLAQQFHEAVAVVRNTAALDNTARLLWRAHAEGQIADADAEAIAEAVQARRAAFARPPSSVALSQVAAASAPRRPARPRSPDKQASIERRRRCAASGALPPQLAAAFTTGEIAALSVIARAVREAGVCILPLDKIAALAGVCRTTAQNAVRAAERLGLLQRQERRRRGLPSLSNVLRIVAKNWLAWLAHGRGAAGLKKLSATNNSLLPKGKSRVTNWRGAALCDRHKENKKSIEGGTGLKGSNVCSPTLRLDTSGSKN